MYNSTLIRKTPLKAKTALKSHTTLKAKKSLRMCSIEKMSRCASVSKKGAKKRPYKPKYAYKSIFTDNLKRCFITGCTEGYHNGKYHMIHVHHIFGASNKANSEKYHFLIPLRDDWHDLTGYGVHRNRTLDLTLKLMCQDYFIENYGTMEDFVSIFGKCWLNDGTVRDISRIREEVIKTNLDAA